MQQAFREQQFGTLLKGWRNQRRMSQLDLGLAANVSARHVSFIETGRAKPSRSMVLQLSETLQVPRSERNALLNAAGFAPAYEKRDLDADEMAHVRAAVEWMLERHDPFPALALDRHWLVVSANSCGRMLLSGVGMDVGDSLLDALTLAPTVREAIVNWPEVAHHTVTRLRTESAHLGGDSVLDAAADRLAAGTIATGYRRDAAGRGSGDLSRRWHGALVFLHDRPVRNSGRHCACRSEDRVDVPGRRHDAAGIDGIAVARGLSKWAEQGA